jgi:hypothetical protein
MKVHRLRLRANNAAAAGEHALAADLRRAIEDLLRLEREAVFARRTTAPPEATRAH